MVALLNGLGGPVGFGTEFLERDETSKSVDISSFGQLLHQAQPFGPAFFDPESPQTQLIINQDGSVIFDPSQIFSGFTDGFFVFDADVDTEMAGIGNTDHVSGLAPTSGGNSQGTNMVWYAIDDANDRLVVTWDDVGYADQNTDARNAFQLIVTYDGLTSLGDNKYHVEYRYEDINWVTGDSDGGTNGLGGNPATARVALEEVIPGDPGFPGDPLDPLDPGIPGLPDEYFQVETPLPQSGDEAGMLDLENIVGNTGQPGRWEFTVVNGEVVDSGLPSVITDFIWGGWWGDPHILTFDGAAYDFHGTGEYVLARETGGGDLEVQARFAPVAANPDLTVTEAVATKLGTANVVIDATDASPVSIDGVATAVTNFSSVAAGNGRIYREDDVYTIVYPGADGVVNDGDERLEVTVHDDRVDPNLVLHQNRANGFEGLLGNPDGDASNDIAYADGTPVDLPLSFSDLYGQFATDWQVAQADSMFFYDAAQGETRPGFGVPTSEFTVSDLDPAVRAAAETAAENAGLIPGTVNFNAAVLDYAITGDPSYLESALGAPQMDEDAYVTDDLTPNQAKVVAYLYEAGLNRDGAIDLPGLNFWIDIREQGLTEHEVSWYFVESDEFVQVVGDVDVLTDEQLVDGLYNNVLNRAPDQAGRDFWLSVYNQPDFDAADLLLYFAESDENIANSTFVETLNEVSPGHWDFVV